VISGARALATPCSQFPHRHTRKMAPVPREGTCAVGSFLSGALSWLLVVTVGLSPMLVYWLAQVIGRALRRKAAGPAAGDLAAELEEGERGKRRDRVPPARRKSWR
jgi:hypothetical protein